ncbi:MFS transporter [Microtetraspora niveoalba]|uniref:MFS transporter n=1 Tax=Microtetraspora niveoalba TaxID=46175 RepID=UPI00082BD741|nr:MFS transporter [Microtetraspora niveoalba]
MTTIEHPPARSRMSGRLAVVAVAVATFSVVTTEMLPVGLLTGIGTGLEVSDGTAGLTMTVPGLVAAVAAPSVTLALGRTDRRRALVGLAGLLAAANLLSAVAPSFPVLVAARVLVGVCIGGVWAIAAGLAVRLVPARSAGRATMLIFSGIAVASVLGVPVGTLAGDLWGWRAAFAVMGLVALAATGALAALLPPLPVERAARVSDVPGLLRAGRVRLGLLTVLLLVTGHFAAYTYVRPLLERIPGFDAGAVSATLLLYGVAGVAGNFLAGTLSRDPRRPLLVICGSLAAVTAAMPLVAGGAAGATVLLALWGLAYGGVSVSTQKWLLTVAPHAPEGVSALFVAAFNVAISLGALLGGRVVDAASPLAVMPLGGLLALGALAATAAGGRRRRRN